MRLTRLPAIATRLAETAMASSDLALVNCSDTLASSEEDLACSRVRHLCDLFEPKEHCIALRPGHSIRAPDCTRHIGASVRRLALILAGLHSLKLVLITVDEAHAVTRPSAFPREEREQ
jgi:hypothetical protein